MHIEVFVWGKIMCKLVTSVTVSEGVDNSDYCFIKWMLHEDYVFQIFWSED